MVKQMSRKYVAHRIVNPRLGTGLSHEKNDCTVRALAITYGIPYVEAHETMRAAGRLDGRPTSVSAIRRAFARLQEKKKTLQLTKIGDPRFSTKEKPCRRVSIATFCKYHQVGTFYCAVNNHAFAVVNGVVVDSGYNNCGKLIDFAWQVV